MCDDRDTRGVRLGVVGRPKGRYRRAMIRTAEVDWMNLDELARNDWIRAATLAHMLLCQALPDEAMDDLIRPTSVRLACMPKAA